MVTQRLFTLSLGVLGVAFASPIRADGVLEALQKEVSSIAANIRSAVVSIEDERSILRINSTLQNNLKSLGQIEGRELPPRELQSLKAQRATLQKALTEVAKAGQAKKRENLKAQMFQLDRVIADAMAQAQHFATLNIFQSEAPEEARVDALEQMGEQLALRVEEALQKYNPDHPKVKSLESQRDSLIKQIDERKNRKGNKEKDVLATQVWNVMFPKTGSGFCIGEGYVVTTSDVLQGMQNPVVLTDNGLRIKAKVVGSRPELNIGLLKLLGKADVPSLRLGDSSTVEAGHFAISMGNQTGQANSVALMLVGGIRNEGVYVGRQFYSSLIQIAGTVGEGASGAPLVNVRGEVIGMLAAVPVGGFAVRQTQELFAEEPMPFPVPSPALPKHPEEGKPLPRAGVFVEPPQNSMPWFFTAPSVTSAGFAIPINNIKPILEEMRSGTPIVRGWIGLAPEDISVATEQEGIVHVETIVRVNSVFPDSPAIRSDIKPGDVILRMNLRPIRTSAEFRDVAVRLRKGETLKLEIQRGKERRIVALMIDARPAKIGEPISLPAKESPKESPNPKL